MSGAQEGVGVQRVRQEAERSGVGGGHVGVRSQVLQQLLRGGKPLPAVRVARYPVAHVGLVRPADEARRGVQAAAAKGRRGLSNQIQMLS